MVDKGYRYIEVMRTSAEALDDALSEMLTDVEARGGEVVSVSLAILPMPQAHGAETKDLIRVAQVIVKEPGTERQGAW